MDVQKHIRQIKRSCELVRKGLHPELSLSRCADYLAWMKQYKKASDEVLNPIIDEVTECFYLMKYIED